MNNWNKNNKLLSFNCKQTIKHGIISQIYTPNIKSHIVIKINLIVFPNFSFWSINWKIENVLLLHFWNIILDELQYSIYKK